MYQIIGGSTAKIRSLPKAVMDDFEEIIAWIESDEIVWNRTMQDMVKLKLKELRSVSDRGRIVSVPVQYMDTTLDNLLVGCMESVDFIIKTAEEAEEDWDLRVSEPEIKLLKRNMNALLVVYEVNPRLSNSVMREISLSPIANDFEDFLENFKRVKTHANMVRAIYELKDLVTKYDILRSENKLIHRIFTKMAVCEGDATVQGMVIEIIPMIRRLSLGLEAGRKAQVAKEVMDMIEREKTGTEIDELVDELEYPEADVAEAVANLMEAGEILEDRGKFYSKTHPPKGKKKGRKPGRKKGKASTGKGREELPGGGKHLEPSDEEVSE